MVRTYVAPLVIALVALAALFAGPGGPSGKPAAAATATAVGIDLNTADNTATSLGTITTCLGGLTAGALFSVDIYVQGVSGGISGFDTTIFYNSGALRVPSVGQGGVATNVNMLLASAPGSAVVPESGLGDVFDTSGLYVAKAYDTGIAENGDGVLARVTFKAQAAGKSALFLAIPSISPALKGGDGLPIGPAAPNGVFTGTVAGAQVYVGSPCPGTNTAPAANSQTATATEDTGLVITLTGSDPEGVCPLAFAITSTPVNGTLASLSTPTCSSTTPSSGSATVTFVPSANVCSPTQGSFQFQVSDGPLTSSAGTVTVNINCVNDPPVAANKTPPSTPEGTPIAVTLSATDMDSLCPLTFAIATSPSSGSLGAIGSVVCTPGAGSSSATAQVTYTPNASFNGSDLFRYTASDSGGALSPLATVSVTVSSVNDPPVASSGGVTTNWNTPKAITLTATDADNDCPLTFAILTPPAGGSLGAIGPRTCTPNTPALGTSTTTAQVTYSPTLTQSGPDSFTWRASDPSLANSPTATISITVNPTDNDADGLLDHLEALPANNCIPGTNADSDGDGLTDGQEVVILGTKCNVADTDGDGFSDSLEMRLTGTATGATATTIVDTRSSYPQPPASPTSIWTANQWARASAPYFFVKITGGTGAGQVRRITSNTATTLTVNAAWTTVPNATSTYSIQRVGTNPLAKCAADTIANNEDPQASPSDLNDDRSVNVLDVSKMFPAWLSNLGDPAYNLRVDLTADGAVNILDISALFPAWLTTCTP